jgi:hypothetical protein
MPGVVDLPTLAWRPGGYERLLGTAMGGEATLVEDMGGGRQPPRPAQSRNVPELDRRESHAASR